MERQLQCDAEEMRQMLNTPLTEEEMDEGARTCGADIIGDAEVAMLLGTMLKQHGMHHPEIPGDFSYSKLVYILRCCACTCARCADELEKMLELPEYDPEHDERNQHA